MVVDEHYADAAGQSAPRRRPEAADPLDPRGVLDCIESLLHIRRQTVADGGVTGTNDGAQAAAYV
jgi:hypothetical protein